MWSEKTCNMVQNWYLSYWYHVKVWIIPFPELFTWISSDTGIRSYILHKIKKSIRIVMLISFILQFTLCDMRRSLLYMIHNVEFSVCQYPRLFVRKLIISRSKWICKKYLPHNHVLTPLLQGFLFYMSLQQIFKISDFELTLPFTHIWMNLSVVHDHNMLTDSHIGQIQVPLALIL